MERLLIDGVLQSWINHSNCAFTQQTYYNCQSAVAGAQGACQLPSVLPAAHAPAACVLLLWLLW
jgi:hypothetical protein